MEYDFVLCNDLNRQIHRQRVDMGVGELEECRVSGNSVPSMHNFVNILKATS